MSTEAISPSPIHELLAKRTSPHVFDSRPVSKEDLLALFEAARWSASAGNEQPWSYIVATRDEPNEYERMLSCVAEVNLPWASLAPVLIIGCVRLHLGHGGGPYPTAEHDLGLASANLVFEATARGLGVHQMTRIDRDEIRRLYGVPEGIGIVSALAIGYAPEDGPASTEAWPPAHRIRKPVKSFVFTGAWSHAWAPAHEPSKVAAEDSRITAAA
jgi:nitroreductase